MEANYLFNSIFGKILDVTRNNEHPTYKVISENSFTRCNEESNDANVINLGAHTLLVAKAFLNLQDDYKIIYYHSYSDNSRTFEMRSDSNYIDLMLIKGNEIIDKKHTVYWAD